LITHTGNNKLKKTRKAQKTKVSISKECLFEKYVEQKMMKKAKKRMPTNNFELKGLTLPRYLPESITRPNTSLEKLSISSIS
jgi:hypothetical protein